MVRIWLSFLLGSLVALSEPSGMSTIFGRVKWQSPIEAEETKFPADRRHTVGKDVSSKWSKYFVQPSSSVKLQKRLELNYLRAFLGILRSSLQNY